MRNRDREPNVGHYEPLGIVGDPAEANLLAARLRSHGIAVRLHGESFGPYPIGVGGLAQVELWVDSDRFDEAREIFADWPA
jgi:hypothetical protein